jgi:cytochrome c-type biogenesis protein CcmH/NrfG
MRAAAVVVWWGILAAAPLAAQKQWVEPQSPCDIKPGFFRLNSAVVDLKKAAQQPNLRDRMLSQAQDVLVRSIRDDNQDQNPAAWYYLGRYYFEVGDAAGADTAFTRAEALAPQCKEDIAGYRTQLGEASLNRGLAAWQAGQADSAAWLLRQAYAVNRANPKALFQLGSFYVERNQLDSGSAVLRRAAAAAAGDTAFADARREALLTVARLAYRSTQSDPAVQKWLRSRFSRDSIAPYIANDSSIMERVDQSSASRKARGARLSPTDQQSFSHDSATRAEALARGRAARASLEQQAATDSAAAQVAFGPAVSAYQGFVAAYPANVDGASTLASILAQAGRRAEASTVFDGLFTHAAQLSTMDLYELGQRLLQAKMLETGARAYTLALERNPYQRNALAELASAYIEAKDTAKAVATARRLAALDPLNKAGLHVVAQAWELRGQADSATHYGRLADTLTVDISIASLVSDSTGATVTGVASNLGSAQSKPLRLTIELLDAKGAVLATQPVDVPGLAPGGSKQFQVRGSGKAIAGWRYRRT